MAFPAAGERAFANPPKRRTIMAKTNRDFEIYLVHIDPDKCDGCELCLIYCPVNVFDLSHKATPVRPQNCLGCRTCEAVCKSNAVTITEI
jgi:NAD-dependent dihydropyrimidine dehydrogenase PreA subunit